MSEQKIKPRVRFCWECGKKLWGNKFIELVVGGHPRILHKLCAKNVQENINAYQDFDTYNRVSDYDRSSICRRDAISADDN